MSNSKRLGKILIYMLLIFIATGLISASLMILGVKFYPPTVNINLTSNVVPEISSVKTPEQIVKAFTTPDFVDILSKKNMLPLILFSLLIGLGTAASGEKGRFFVSFLQSGSHVMMKVISYIMLYAPIGLCAYFAYLTGNFGTQLFGSYLHAVMLYYPLSFLYFLIGFSIYAWLAGGLRAIKMFWSNILPPSVTALGTGSSIATIPSNLQAADRIGIPRDVSEIIIPIGATVHMDGSCLAAILKIALLFSIFHIPFTGLGTILTAIGIAILCGVVISGIPSGGMLGEMLIVTLYGFPIEALPIISMVGILVDPPATMVNAIGDNIASMLVARILNGKNWMEHNQ